MIDETIQLEDDEELEEEAEVEVDKVLFELTDGKLGQAGSVGTELPVSVAFISISPHLHLYTGRAERRGRGRGTTPDGAVSRTAQWITQWLTWLTFCIHMGILYYFVLDVYYVRAVRRSTGFTSP
jgi:hypothetical protein